MEFTEGKKVTVQETRGFDNGGRGFNSALSSSRAGLEQLCVNSALDLRSIHV